MSFKIKKTVTLKLFKSEKYLIWKVEPEVTFHIHSLLNIIIGEEEWSSHEISIDMNELSDKPNINIDDTSEISLETHLANSKNVMGLCFRLLSIV